MKTVKWYTVRREFVESGWLLSLLAFVSFVVIAIEVTK